MKWVKVVNVYKDLVKYLYSERNNPKRVGQALPMGINSTGDIVKQNLKFEFLLIEFR